ncbi:MAG TPA: hypothetical protein VGM88_05800 [Kofleriaceae bacterium]
MKPLVFLLAVSACGVLAVSACGGTSQPVVSSSSSGSGLAAWETVRSVLQHPRCQNCHPAGDQPLQGDDSHAHIQNVQRGPTGHGRVGEECTTCHQLANAPSSYGPHAPPGVSTGWRMPTAEQPLVFVGRSSRDLCLQLRDPAANGGKDFPALRHHLDDPLVTWGWTPGGSRVPVPVPRPQFLAAFETWLAAGAPCPAP